MGILNESEGCRLEISFHFNTIGWQPAKVLVVTVLVQEP